jgi:hypothetical protein
MTAQPELALGWLVVRFSGPVPQKFGPDGLDRSPGCRDSRLYRDPERDRQAGNPPCSRTVVPCATPFQPIHPPRTAGITNL